MEEICEEKFDGITVVEHGALRQDLVHCHEDKVLILDFLHHPIIKFIEFECVGKSVQEHLVSDRHRTLIIFLVLSFIIFAYDKLVQQDQDQNSAALSNVLAKRQNHNVVQLAQVEHCPQLIYCLTVF